MNMGAIRLVFEESAPVIRHYPALQKKPVAELGIQLFRWEQLWVQANPYQVSGFEIADILHPGASRCTHHNPAPRVATLPSPLRHALEPAGGLSKLLDPRHEPFVGASLSRLKP